MEDMGTVAVYIDALDIFTVNVSACVFSLFKNQAGLSRFFCMVRKDSGEKSAAHQQVIVLFLHKTVLLIHLGFSDVFFHQFCFLNYSSSLRKIFSFERIPRISSTSWTAANRADPAKIKMSPRLKTTFFSCFHWILK